jgi:hypothetical protein
MKATLALVAAAVAVHAQNMPLAGYTPNTDVTEHARIARY